MGSLRRYIAAGATFAWPLTGNILQETRDRHTVSGTPGVCNSPYGYALDFDGLSDYWNLGAAWEDQVRFDSGTQDFSIVAWVKHSVSGDFQRIFDKRDGLNDGWALRTIANDTVSFLLNNTNTTSTNPLIEGRWHTVGVSVVRAGNAQVYIDGVADGAPVAIGGAVMATTMSPRVGAGSFAATNLWTGCMAGIVIFPRALSAEEHAGTASGGGPF